LLNNFTIQDEENPSTILKGLEGKRIVCMANLKNPKNHSFLVEIANQINITYPEWSFHFIGKDFRDDYSNQIKEKIKKYNLNETVFIYGVKNDTFNILQQSDIAVLTSISEGMPVSLIEYGMMKMPVVLTKVGEIPFIIEDQKNGFLVDLNDINSFCNCLAKLINDKSLRNSIGNALFETIDMKFSSNKVISKYLNWIES
jgi:glycosyltransferase involved in cell wall biosynthesis